MKQFVVFAALVAVACAGLLPHHSHHQHQHRAAASRRVDNSYLAPAAESRVDNSYLAPVAESRVESAYLAPAESRVAPAAVEAVLVSERLHENNGLEGYSYSYEISDGQKKEETAELINQGTDEEAIAVRGSFEWVDPQTNQHFKVNYVADENGFRAEGDHIPRA
ncbi:larval cuticle protein 65Ag1-like [Leptopilina heterotoma]|uniref:larval cuticle protein 65Ag1-like n=1 Tax=Leptopilina heterotoma TaxID=63436 RepID=UPI001CAA086E|nr:larval cuticle protein 65Ag1-like [Leptopilina heterotoma]XP_043484457.1 larval cuticle protein 65Ag1-like [Leptopilina heterotoma]